MLFRSNQIESFRLRCLCWRGRVTAPVKIITSFILFSPPINLSACASSHLPSSISFHLSIYFRLLRPVKQFVFKCISIRKTDTKNTVSAFLTDTVFILFRHCMISRYQMGILTLIYLQNPQHNIPNCPFSKKRSNSG